MTTHSDGPPPADDCAVEIALLVWCVARYGKWPGDLPAASWAADLPRLRRLVEAWRSRRRRPYAMGSETQPPDFNPI